jgi:hypothetical protein
MAASESTEFDLGSRVRVAGLVQASHHNGKTGVIIAALDPQTGRMGVELEDGAEIRIKPCNMQLLQHPDDTAPHAAPASPAQPPAAPPAIPPAPAVIQDSETDRVMLEFCMRQGMSPEQARRSVVMANKKRTDNVTAAIEYAASVKRDAGIKQHLARFGLKNVIKDCGDWSRFPGTMTYYP